MTKEWSFPASFAQERVWLANQLDPHSPVYNLSKPVSLPAGLSVAQAQEAFGRVVARHEALRTYFRSDGDTLVQVVRDVEPVPALEVVELAAVSPAEADDRFLALAEQLSRTPIPLEQTPLWRAKLVRDATGLLSLLLVAHHAIFDSSSALVLEAELTEIAAALLAGREPRLPPLDIQYADFAVWQREQLAGAELERQLDFWRTHLSAAPEVIGLTTDRPRPQHLGFAGDEIWFDPPAGLLDEVDALARQHAATPQMVLLTAFAAVLSRLTASSDVVIGLSTSGRDLPQLVPLIGMFVNPVALRVDVSGDPTFTELLARVRATLLDVMEHWHAPFQKIVEAVAPRRDPSVQPVFQVAFNYIPDTGFDKVKLGTTKDDLAFDLTAGTSRLLYRTALFDRATAESIVDKYVRLLAAGVAEPATRVGDLPLLTDAEYAMVTRDWAGGVTSATAAGADPIPVLFDRQVAATPGAAALVAGDTTLTYAELNTAASRLAHTLRERGAGGESLVALVLPRGADLVVAVLAVLKSGAAYLPIEPAYPAERIAFLLTDAAPVLVVADPAVDLPAGVARVAPTQLADELPDLSDVDIRGEYPAYVIYTSGSTGKPKGVVVEHRSASAYLGYAHAAYPGLAGTALLHSPVSFDLTVTALLGPLTCGGTVRLAAIDDPAARADSPPTFVKTTPGQLSLLDSGSSPTGELVVGGEALTAQVLHEWRAANPDAVVVNEYGPTEATVGCVALRIEPGARLPAGPVGIGRPISGMRAYVLDDRLNPVPPGVTGELYVAGVQVARGYLNRPGLTAQRFLPCPFGLPGERMYRTGDLARWRRDGTLDFLGRTDHQVKVRGMRVELEEITAALLEVDGVREAAVLPHEDGLVGYVVGRVAGAVDSASLSATLARTLPEHMVPQVFVELDALPLTTNGKLDRAALPEPEFRIVEEFIPPRTDTEALVAGVFAEILGVNKVGALDNFLDLGGNSLRGMRAMAKLRGEIDVDVPMRALFSFPVVADLAAEIDRLLDAELDALSDEEMAALLADETSSP